MGIKRGQVWYANLKNVNNKSSIQKGVRPVIIVSNDANNRFSNVLQVIAFTTKHKAKLPTHIDVKAEECCIAEDSTILCEQIISIDVWDLKDLKGEVIPEVMTKVDKGIKIQLGIA